MNLCYSRPNLHKLLITNPRGQDGELHPKVKPLPIGLKWQFKNTPPFTEDKTNLEESYSSVASSAKKSKSLFELANRTNTVFIRPMIDSNVNTKKYEKINKALQTPRSHIFEILMIVAPNATKQIAERIDTAIYFQELRKHRFFISPAGNGMDTHGTWEALLAGCIPIVPRSLLDPMFNNLPVWLVDSWEEVTTDAIEEKARHMTAHSDKYDWKRVFCEGLMGKRNI